MAEAAQKVADAQAAAQEAQQQLTQAEAKAQTAEQAKIELSLKLAEMSAQQHSPGGVSGVPSAQAADSDAADKQDLQKRYATKEQ